MLTFGAYYAGFLCQRRWKKVVFNPILIGPQLIKFFRLRDAISQGVGFGAAFHVIGTSKAMELSPLIGAVSSMSLTLAGLITSVIFSFLFASSKNRVIFEKGKSSTFV